MKNANVNARAVKMLALIITLFFCGTSCGSNDNNNDMNNEPDPPVFVEDPNAPEFVDEEGYWPGCVIVKFIREVPDEFVINISDEAVTTGFAELDATLSYLKVYDMEASFAVGGKFEERRREAGLHLFYTFIFDENVPVKKAIYYFKKLDIVESVDPNPIAVVD